MNLNAGRTAPTIATTDVHAAFDDDAENVGTHDIVKDLERQGLSVVDAGLLERHLTAARSRLATVATQLETLGAESRSAGYPELAGELERIAREARRG